MGIPYSQIDFQKPFVRVGDLEMYSRTGTPVPVYKKVSEKYAHHMPLNQPVKTEPDELVIEIIQ